MSQIIQTKLITETAKGTRIKCPATLEFTDGRILFVKSPFALKDEIKAMRGSKWHGHDEEDGRKIWSVEDCQRNRFQLDYLQRGSIVYEWFDREIIRHQYHEMRLDGKPVLPMPHQFDLADSGLTYHYQIWAAEMGVGKTLAAQMVMEQSGKNHWYWLGPKSSLPNIRREFRRWGFPFEKINVEFFNYEALAKIVDEWEPGTPVPQGMICDESSRCKGEKTQRTKACQAIADMIRERYGFDGYTILMSGTPSPKSPVDWWAQCEIAWPGFLKEGSPKALEQRLAFLVDKEYDTGVFKKRTGWRDDERKCRTCGLLYEEGPHDPNVDVLDEYHKFEGSKNEVAFMYERLKGLVQIKHKKDCVKLPEKRYRKIFCRPNPSTLRVARAIAESSPNTVTGMMLLRELSDGFQYRDIEDGMTKCPHCPEHCGKVVEYFNPSDEDATYSAVDFLDEELVKQLEKREVDCPRCGGDGEIPKLVRIAKEVPCPKQEKLEGLLEECEETGRIVIFAGFTGSVDRVQNICLKNGWDVVRCDGRGFHVSRLIKEKGDKGYKVETVTGVEPLDYWANLTENPRVAFVAHPESGGMSLTLVEARMAVYWSNSFKPEYRSQSEDRIHRKGMDENLGCEIVDLVHLPTDLRVLQVIQENRKLELMTMGEFAAALKDDALDPEQYAEELAA
jgi:hypothetical protein